MAAGGAGDGGYRLQPGHELRLEVEAGKTVHVRLTEGQAEVFGTALELGERIAVSAQKLAVYSWQGCRLELEGEPDMIYESDETPMQQYLNMHAALEARRAAAKHAGEEGPRVCIVGPTDAGKSTLCKILLNYAVRHGWSPTFADLDIGQGSITVPGSVAATPVEAPIDVEEGLTSDAPLVYFYGNSSPSENLALYKHLVERLAAVLALRAQSDGKARSAGLFINSMGWIEDLGYELLCHTLDTLRANVVLVVGSERLYSQLASELHGKGTEVVKVPRSGGVVVRSRELRAVSRRLRVEEYFYGPMRQLTPASQTAKLDDLEIYKVGGNPRAPSSALPIGATSVSDPLRVTRITNPQELLYTMLAVSHAPSAELLLAVNVAGFVYVQDVDLASGTLTLLAPCAGQLPSKLLICGSFKTYLE